MVVNTQYQWMPHWQELLAEIAAGRLGEIRSIRAVVGVDILEQGPHALSLAMAAAGAVGTAARRAGSSPERTAVSTSPAWTYLPTPPHCSTWATLRLTLTAGNCAPPVPGETVRAFQQQTEIVGSARTDLGEPQPRCAAAGWLAATRNCRPRWDRDDYASQTGLFAAIAAAIDDPVLRASFPTRLDIAASQARMLFGAIESAATGRRVSLS